VPLSVVPEEDVLVLVDVRADAALDMLSKDLQALNERHRTGDGCGQLERHAMLVTRADDQGLSGLASSQGVLVMDVALNRGGLQSSLAGDADEELEPRVYAEPEDVEVSWKDQLGRGSGFCASAFFVSLTCCEAAGCCSS
jgi:hypothetical protein